MIYEALINLKTKNEPGVLMTVVEKFGHGPAKTGTKMLVSKSGNRTGTIGGGALEFAAIKHCDTIIKEQKSTLVKYLLSEDNSIIEPNPESTTNPKMESTGMMCGGTITLFFEYINAGPPLYIFGAGHIGRALVHHLHPLNYHITILDCREGLAENIENVQHRITCDYENALKDEKIPENAFFLIASHSHQLDYVILKRIFQAQWEPKYVGLIASKRKSRVMLEQLAKDLEINSAYGLEPLYSPVGLDTGGQTPHEIALSIIAEMQVVRYEKPNHMHMKQKALNKEKA